PGNLDPVDIELPHLQSLLGPADAPSHADRHEVVGRIVDPDGERELAVADRPGRGDVGEVTGHQRSVPREAPVSSRDRDEEPGRAGPPRDMVSKDAAPPL